MKRTSGAAYLADRDKASNDEVKQQKTGWKTGGGFADFLREPTKKIVFEPVLESPCAGGQVMALVKPDEQHGSADKALQPKCAWWQFQHTGPPVGPVESNVLDLSKLDKDVALVALLAHVSESKTINDASSNHGFTTAKTTPAWTARLGEGSKPEDRRELIRLRRSEGCRTTGVWLVACIIKESTGDTCSWRAQAIDEVYPEKRIKALLPMRFKDLVPAPPEEKEDDPMAATRRLLEEAMKNS
eukprot:TRINITY_DN47856_c0_g1_i1.p1 TRINITY_DN47856_c0_g1~~TRINITY_DN47856_c0_g1_i1.p1  ORF type:complete len:243 (+),score=58.21 TRINITY_DN47856_c0_g1_i1:32-760(+)